MPTWSNRKGTVEISHPDPDINAYMFLALKEQMNVQLGRAECVGTCENRAMAGVFVLACAATRFLSYYVDFEKWVDVRGGVFVYEELDPGCDLIIRLAGLFDQGSTFFDLAENYKMPLKKVEQTVKNWCEDCGWLKQPLPKQNAPATEIRQ